MTSSPHMLCARYPYAIGLLCVMALMSLACSNGVKFAFQRGDFSDLRAGRARRDAAAQPPPAPAEETAPPPLPEQVEEPSAAENAVGPEAPPVPEVIEVGASTEAIAQKSRALDLPAPPEGSGVAGPFEGPRASLVYLSSRRALTLYHPELHVAYFARVDEDQVRWTFAASTRGYFRAGPRRAWIPVTQPPQELTVWPMSIPVAQRIAERAQRYLDEGGRDDDLIAERRQLWEQLQRLDPAEARADLPSFEAISAPTCTPRSIASVYLGCY